MKSTKIYLDKLQYSLQEEYLFENDKFKVSFFEYPSGVKAIKVDNKKLNFVLLPYMGHQIWFAEFEGKKLYQKSIFDYPLETKRFGDTYGAFLIHCGLTNINGPGENEDYPIHGELPFAQFKNNYLIYGQDLKGEYISITGLFDYRNSQEYYWEYCPELRTYENSSLLEMHITINNKRHNNLDYLFMCHLNWLGVDGSELIYTAKKDLDHFRVQELTKTPSSQREKRLIDFVNSIKDNPFYLDRIDFDKQVFMPELCVNIKYQADSQGMSHSMQLMPDLDACYVSFKNDNLPYGLRWYCKSEDENGLGFCLPTTGTNDSSRYQYEHGYYNTIAANSSDELFFKFGYLDKENAREMKERIEKINREV